MRINSLCTYPHYLLPKGKQTEKFSRRGRPWPREREGPTAQRWEGFTGLNFYGLVM